MARHLHLSPDPFLMAVATGAGCDFLTPVGHQCNTLVLGPGGYRFSDYARLGRAALAAGDRGRHAADRLLLASRAALS